MLLTVNDALAMDAPDRRELLWGDEFDQPAGSPPDPRWWKAELGDGTATGDPRWGNEELQVYTDGADNVVHDGQSNLVLTARRSAARCSSARLITKGNVLVLGGCARCERLASTPSQSGTGVGSFSFSADVDVERDVPPMVARRRRRELDLRDDLRVEMQMSRLSVNRGRHI
jgi:hypothetical protein